MVSQPAITQIGRPSTTIDNPETDIRPSNNAETVEMPINPSLSNNDRRKMPDQLHDSNKLSSGRGLSFLDTVRNFVIPGYLM